MNEFQKAINSIASKISCYMPSYVTSEDENIEKLQQLVNKETPMKVKNIRPAGLSLYIGECPRCNTTIDYLDYPYTCCAKGCRQALDWGKDDQ